MKITHPKQINQFLDKGILATLRNSKTYLKKVGQVINVMIRHQNKNIGEKAKIIYAGEIFDFLLRRNVAHSGFKDIAEWIREETRASGRKPKYIVVIKRINNPLTGWFDADKVG